MKYLHNKTKLVTDSMWLELADKIRHSGIRNVTTISIPPTGRSALTIDASTSIEPYFSLVNDDGKINIYLLNEVN